MLSRSPRSRVLSENYAATYAHEMRTNDAITQEQHERILKSVIQFYCKDLNKDIDFVVWKPPPMDSNEFPIIKKIFGAKFVAIFNTRHPKNSLISFLKIVEHQKSNLYAKTPFSWNKWISLMPFAYNEVHMSTSILALKRSFNRWWPPRMIEATPLLFGLVLESFKNHREIYSGIFFYEDIRAEPETELRRILGLLKGAETEFIPSALEALDEDSQKATFGKREEKIKSLNSRTLKDCEKIANVFGLSLEMTMTEFRNNV